MTIDEIKTRIRDIEDCAGDDERQHAKEDEMVWEFIYTLAHPDECDPALSLADVTAMAVELLKSQRIEFNRWCG